ncbi:YrhB family protein [Micromonospora sp. RHAY321]|uniref:YrhB domain-containing protein n=1 Tax=Micromonospora sp. RHAY321 TaxID=2944807 RepID=UPI00207CFF4D|nr:YrhB domain-containing protein [Micromonospora sp. RHAY321]MCO1596195.1 YrhB family protein [Micromonospora sp. RHAY321]
MINEQDARTTAEAVLRDMSTEPGVPPLAITNVEEHPTCWVFYYQSVRYIESGSFLDSVAGNAPILVDRNTGQHHQTGTARSAGYYISEFANGRHTCALCRTAQV